MEKCLGETIVGYSSADRTLQGVIRHWTYAIFFFLILQFLVFYRHLSQDQHQLTLKSNLSLILLLFPLKFKFLKFSNVPLWPPLQKAQPCSLCCCKICCALFVFHLFYCGEDLWLYKCSIAMRHRSSTHIPGCLLWVWEQDWKFGEKKERRRDNVQTSREQTVIYFSFWDSVQILPLLLIHLPQDRFSLCHKLVLTTQEQGFTSPCLNICSAQTQNWAELEKGRKQKPFSLSGTSTVTENRDSTEGSSWTPTQK